MSSLLIFLSIVLLITTSNHSSKAINLPVSITVHCKNNNLIPVSGIIKHILVLVIRIFSSVLKSLSCLLLRGFVQNPLVSLNADSDKQNRVSDRRQEENPRMCV